ncbi:hypothetical protein COU62_03830 [Candidatus Pacearchaeota archaeon CG10_big_fil_rev_8_21_14_0_10_35_219]|nr:hypothetical protein [Candidatus Pacearchaeota archaeon]OIO42285.1 MAG: hypothetical protein AUJ63_03340 [Candidatus Pacearchaeota archaeon CG1_02_35_32]PIO07481.1 MAG: hypothetical protein COU62_03830 [Candidatus Pacearchaeota archaeon CG10_big_fil_rev_8_21_14_0_10_35_219]PIY81287.1 MAG: hypothetical protein COY79_03325 [Candidatus Pacearchaeota archaeon CG_4_10_14_0_8_um_filter_35_169]PIZ80216.1 MAG: hypothetical protein COY00_01970 [Candidatus Pacearchaeota archaeon CG_4_10_14_0_2_um_filt
MEVSAENSSGVMCPDLLTGDVDFVAQVLAKDSFEPSTRYLLTRALGGAVLDYSGKDIGNKNGGLWEITMRPFY